MLTRLSLGLIESVGKEDAALTALGFIYKRWIEAGQVLRGCHGLAKDSDVFEFHYPAFQAVRTVKFIPDVAGIFLVF